jgi:hypothetical protein
MCFGMKGDWMLSWKLWSKGPKWKEDRHSPQVVLAGGRQIYDTEEKGAVERWRGLADWG